MRRFDPFVDESFSSTHPIKYYVNIYSYLIGELERQSVSQLQYRSWASGAVDSQTYFKTGPLQCLRDVPQRLMFLNII